MRIRASLAALALITLGATGSVASAQRGEAGRETTAVRGRGNRDGQAMARQLRQAFGAVVRRQLSLSDDKWKQFERVDRQFQQQRTQLQRNERETRQALKSAMEDTTNVDQAKIAQYLTELTQGQRRRADLLEAEQKELATFLTPLQRAKLQALREQLAQRVAQLRQDGGPGRGGARRGGRP